MSALLRSQTRRIVASVMIAVCYWFVPPPDLDDAERARLTSQFRFHRISLPELNSHQQRPLRNVHPDLEHVAMWISAVGASIALNDLDADGLPNDACYVDTRTNQVVVAPVPGTANRYSAFTLSPDGLPYDANTMAPMGCLPGDLNEDGRQDILVYYWGRTPVAFLNRRTADSGSAAISAEDFIAHEVLATGERWFTNAVTRADVDGDGRIDLIVGNYFKDGARILDPSSSSPQEMQDSMSRAFNGGRNRVLLSKPCPQNSADEPQIHFADVAGVFEEHVAHGWCLAVGAADLDGDQLPEIYFAHDFGPDRLLHNRSQPGRPKFALLEGEKKLTTPGSKVLGRDAFKGMGVDFADINGDGQLDIYVSNIAAEYALEESHFVFINTGASARMRDGIAPFTDQGESLGMSRSGWGWESRLADFNNDGVLEAVQATGFSKGTVNRWPELHELAMGNDQLLHRPDCWFRCRPGDDLSGHEHNPFFVRGSNGRFYDLAADLGIATPQVTRGIATADVDGDGDLDFAIANQWSASFFYRNDAPQAGTFLGIRLLLSLESTPTQPPVEVLTHTARPPVACRPAIGAQARLMLPNGQTMVGHVDGGNGHSGARDSALHFGLGKFDRTGSVQVELSWRDSQGIAHHDSIELSPGWRTVVLKGAALPNYARK